MAQQLNNSTDLSSRITIDPEICHGKPCIRGLRYPVETILELLSAGMTHEDILADYWWPKPLRGGRDAFPLAVVGGAQKGSAGYYRPDALRF